MKSPDDGELLQAIVDLADDGFAARGEIAGRLPKLSRRDLTKKYGRLARRGLVLERRAPDGGTYFALTGEGWRVHRGVGASGLHSGRRGRG